MTRDMKRTLSLLITATLVLAACSQKARNASQVAARPDIYPDYVGVTIPTGISPLDFTVKGTDALDVVLKSPDGKTLRSGGKASTKFPIKKWARLLQKSIGDSVMVSVSARKNGKWESYEPFGMYVSPAEIWTVCAIALKLNRSSISEAKSLLFMLLIVLIKNEFVHYMHKKPSKLGKF